MLNITHYEFPLTLWCYLYVTSWYFFCNHLELLVGRLLRI